MKLAFVCSGNICRSPMAQVIAQDQLKARGHSGMAISAGTLNLQGRRAASHARAVAAAHGLDLESHRSQGIQNKMITFADHVFVMSPHHERDILALYPALAPRIVQMWQWVPESLQRGPLSEIQDPVNKDVAHFERCFEEIHAGLCAWMDARDQA